jgi:hypothetical protein
MPERLSCLCALHEDMYGNGGITPLIPYLGAILGWGVNFALRPLCPRKIAPVTYWMRFWVVSRSDLWRLEEEAWSFALFWESNLNAFLLSERSNLGYCELCPVLLSKVLLATIQPEANNFSPLTAGSHFSVRNVPFSYHLAIKFPLIGY